MVEEDAAQHTTFLSEVRNSILKTSRIEFALKNFHHKRHDLASCWVLLERDLLFVTQSVEILLCICYILWKNHWMCGDST